MSLQGGTRREATLGRLNCPDLDSRTEMQEDILGYPDQSPSLLIKNCTAGPGHKEGELVSNAIRDALMKLEWFIKLLETYKKTMWGGQCRFASQIIVDLTVLLQDANARTMKAQSECDLLCKQLVEARLRLASFAPHAQSTELRHLRIRQTTASYLREVVTDATALLAACSGSNDDSHQEE